MSCRRWPVRWRASVAAAIFFRPFLLKEKDQKFKADIIGPNTQSGRFPAMSTEARAPNPVEGWRTRIQQTMLTPFAVIAGLTRNLLRNTTLEVLKIFLS